MLLANQLFEEVLGTLTASAGVSAAAAATGPTGGGQRREPRIALSQRLTLFPFAPGAEGLAGYDFPRTHSGALQLPLSDPLSVPVRDLSRGGLRFLMPRRLPLDTPFVLLLPRLQMAGSPTGMSAPAAIECTVTYWQPIQRELFGIGARFLRLLTGFVPPAIKPGLVLPAMPSGAATPAADSQRGSRYSSMIVPIFVVSRPQARQGETSFILREDRTHRSTSRINIRKFRRGLMQRAARPEKQQSPSLPSLHPAFISRLSGCY